MRSRPGCFGARDRALGVCAIWPRRSRSASRRASRGCASMSDSGRSASICAALAFGPRAARRGFWSRFRPWAPRAPNRLRRPTAATLRRLRTCRRPMSTSRRRRIRASCGPSMRKAVLARRILRSLPRSAPTRRAVASPSRPCSAAPNLDGGGELVRVLAGRKTFSGIAIGWPLPGSDRRRLVTLSAAPLFGRHREFLGYRGFGVLAEDVDAEPAPAAYDAQTVGGSPEGAADPADQPETDFAPPPAETPEGASPGNASFDADGSELAPALPEAGEAVTAAERTAEIYVLRQPALPPASNIVPIRPGRSGRTELPGAAPRVRRRERRTHRERARRLPRDRPRPRRPDAGWARRRLGRPDGIGDRGARGAARKCEG